METKSFISETIYNRRLLPQQFGGSRLLQYKLNHQPLFSPHRNWMSAMELSRILMRVVSESKLLTWGVAIEHRPRSGMAECSQTPSATIGLEMSAFITSGLACRPQVVPDSTLNLYIICPVMWMFWGWWRETEIVSRYNHCSKSEMFCIISPSGDMSVLNS